MRRAFLFILLCLPSAFAAGEAPWSEGPIECYSVPPLSSIRRLPDQLPEDARLGSELRMVAAQGEFEPASFLIRPRVDIAKLELKPTALTGPGGEIPASAVDIKIVKVWFQAGTAWYSYFGDSNRRELVPELLLNDETLVEVDEKAQENYLRVGDEYRWISYPKEKAEKAFNYLTEPVADSRTLQPIRLKKGRNKQIWVTVKVPRETREGIYRGQIRMTADGKQVGAMNLAVRVLPFELPLPKTYYNLENDFLVSLYGTDMLGLADRLKIPRETSEKQQKAIYEDLLDHNIFNARPNQDIRGDLDADAAKLKRELEMMKETGFVMKPLLSSGWSYPLNNKETDEQFQARIDRLSKTFKEVLGHDDVYITSWDEAGVDRIKIMREKTEYTNKQDLELWVTTAAGKHFELAGYIIDYANHGGWPKRENALQWHAVGSKVASYAGPHTGPGKSGRVPSLGRAGALQGVLRRLVQLQVLLPASSHALRKAEGQCLERFHGRRVPGVQPGLSHHGRRDRHAGLGGFPRGNRRHPLRDQIETGRGPGNQKRKARGQICRKKGADVAGAAG